VALSLSSSLPQNPLNLKNSEAPSLKIAGKNFAKTHTEV